MPLVDSSSYRPPRFLKSGHLQTIIPSLFRKVDGVAYTRERIETPDGDFLDLDWSRVNAERAAIVAHGLEGHSKRAYMKGMVKALNRNGWDAVAWNLRGCSGEMNRKVRFYHSGDTADLDTVVRHVLKEKRYRRLALVGFSVGGNIVAKYVGELGSEAVEKIYRAVAISVPCDLQGSAEKIARPVNKIYLVRFLRMLREKIRRKAALFPAEISAEPLRRVKSFYDFDNLYTAPLHGFRDAVDYWQRSGCARFLHQIAVPTLIINAANDPFLTPGCYPREPARKNPCLYLEIPDSGGHVGFIEFNTQGEYWSERRTVQFLNEGSNEKE